jgi:sugar/nucleoside kinase (ribokinase family)
VGDEVELIAPSDLPDDLVEALASLEVLVASREDLAAAADVPQQQIQMLRRRVGPRPVLIVTDGPEGIWIDWAHRQPEHLAVPWRVDDVPTVGAGDAFAALYVARLAGAGLPVDPLRFDPRGDRHEAAHYAMRGVAEMLESRRD